MFVSFFESHESGVVFPPRPSLSLRILSFCVFVFMTSFESGDPVYFWVSRLPFPSFHYPTQRPLPRRGRDYVRCHLSQVTLARGRRNSRLRVSSPLFGRYLIPLLSLVSPTTPVFVPCLSRRRKISDFTVKGRVVEVRRRLNPEGQTRVQLTLHFSRIKVAFQSVSFEPRQ